jgi:hypothetical protein
MGGRMITDPDECPMLGASRGRVLEMPRAAGGPVGVARQHREVMCSPHLSAQRRHERGQDKLPADPDGRDPATTRIAQLLG